MRRFHSYGPVNREHHFCVPRADLVRRCADQLLGISDREGHFFTIWAPRQTGKTWLMRQVTETIASAHGDRFTIGTMSMQGLIMNEDDPDQVFFDVVPRLFRIGLSIEVEAPRSWNQWTDLFSAANGVLPGPTLLFIDEFDSLPRRILDHLVTLFRDIYLSREGYLLHGLALIGVRAVLGMESLRGSPFNIQRSLHVPNFTPEEVGELFRQYRSESGQVVDAEVTTAVYEATRGQPGMVCWFGELLTETYRPDPGSPITLRTWRAVYAAALHKEWNNTVLNLIRKARGPYEEYVLELFTTSDLPFTIRAEWCAYLYLNGIIDLVDRTDDLGNREYICRFSSPFVQACLYEAFTMDLPNDRSPVLALEPLDTLADVFEDPEPDIPALLGRYTRYLKRLRARGIDPWKEQPRRSDLRLTEYVGHFHLYFWLQNAVGRRCLISPEFPTGNGRVDLHLRCGEGRAIIEVKSFRDQAALGHARNQAAEYARKLALPGITIALFVPVEEEDVLARLSGRHEMDGVTVTVVAIAWI